MYLERLVVFLKKLLIIGIVLILIIFKFLENKDIIIPQDSIRFRIIPNSNSIEDLYIKQKVLESVENQIIFLGQNEEINDVRSDISNNINLIKTTVDNTLKINNSNLDYNVKYGLNYFPNKNYKGVIYKEGYYESLVVELGEAEGDNFWCVMFPPLCFLEAEESEEIEYKSLILQVINKIKGYKKETS